MADEMFIKQVAALTQRFGPQYGIMVNSPVIAQFILESGGGTSELAINAHNYCGLKYKLKSDGTKRCPTALDEPYYKVGSEQDPVTGLYVSSEMKWFQFANLTDCVKGYYDFTNIGNYANLKGVTSPEEYLRLIKQDGYATSIDYVSNLMNVIDSYNLTQYDSIQNGGETMLRLALGAGHYLGTPGKRCLKSIDPNETKEWVLNDRICDLVQAGLAKYEGVSLLRLDDTTGQKEVTLAERKKLAENFGADIYISVHHNAGVNGGSGGGTVVFCYQTAFNKAQAQRIYDAVVGQTGLIGNRSAKVGNGNNLYECYAPTMASYIIENGFMDSKADTPIILTEAHAKKTAQGIINFLVAEYKLKEKVVQEPIKQPSSNGMTFVPVEELRYEEVVAIDYETLSDLAKRYGKNADWLLENNPGIYSIGNGTYLVDKHTSIYVG